jgi:hypothetical protein
MRTKKLKLPDGGTFNLPVPDEFGNAGTGLMAAMPTSRTAMYVVGAVGGAVAGVLLILIASKISDAIERR